MSESILMPVNTAPRMVQPAVAYPIPGPEVPVASRPFAEYWLALKRYRKRIAAFVLFATALVLLVSLRLPKIYEATAVIDIDRQGRSGLVGEEALRPGFQDAEQFIATQMALIRSDAVLRPVAERYHLLEHEGQARPLPAGPERPDPAEAPVQLKNLRVTHPPNTYLLQISYRSTDPRLAAAVANDIAHSYLQHVYEIRLRASRQMTEFMERQLEQLRAKMEQSSRALAQFERELNVINPEEKTNILSARLLELNKEYTEAQADRIRKQSLLQALQQGDVEVVAAAGYGEDLQLLQRRLNEARQEFAEVQVHYGANHPQYRKAAARIEELEQQLATARQRVIGQAEAQFRQALARERMLEQAVAQTKADLDQINARSFEYQTLKREADSDKALYEELVRKIREAGINASYENSSIRIADLARPPVDPVAPNVWLNVVLALVLSTLLGCGAAIVADTLDSTVRDSERLARSLQVEVLGALPQVKSWRSRGLLQGPTAAKALVLARDSDPEAVQSFQEAIRTLRNSILLGDLDRTLRSILVTSALPGEGKSTTAVHLALAHASQRHRTLLIDGDLRRPSLHKKLNLKGVEGLSTVLAGGVGWRELVQEVGEIPGLYFLPAGPPSTRASDLIGPGLAELIEQAAAEYELVVIDAPPVGGFAEALQMAALVDGVLLVARAGQTERKAVGAALSLLRRVRANVLGLVLNEVNEAISDYRYYYHPYRSYARGTSTS